MARDLRLLQFSQTLDEVDTSDAYRIVQFSGEVGALLVRQDNGLRILSQSGEAICHGAYLKPPAPLFPDALLERGKVTRIAIAVNRYKTTWSYVMALAPSDTYNTFTHTRWPASPASSPGFDVP